MTPIRAGISPNYKVAGIAFLVLSAFVVSEFQTVEAEPVTGAIGAVTGQALYNAKVDTTRKAVEKILRRVDTMCQSLMTQGLSELSVQQLEFFNNIRVLLQDFQDKYESSLDLTVNTLGQEASSQLAQIDTMVREWTDLSTKPDVVKTAQQLQAIFTNLAFVSDIPKVSAFYPSFASPYQKNGYVTIECVGIFPPVSSTKLEPRLITANNTYSVSENIGGILRFHIPFEELFSEDNNLITFYTVHIPHLQKGWLWNSIVEYKFKGSITLLPDSPGKIVLQSARIEEVVKTKEIRSQGYFQTSRPYGFNRTELNHPYPLTTEPGWQIVPGTTKFNVHENKGKKKTSSWTLAQDNPYQVIWHVSTHKYSPKDHCDKIRFDISATAAQTIKNSVPTENEISLKWGDSVIIGTHKEDAKITYQAFDGTTQVLLPNTHGKYVDLVNKNGKLILSAKLPEQIVSFPLQRANLSPFKI